MCIVFFDELGRKVVRFSTTARTKLWYRFRLGGDEFDNSLSLDILKLERLDERGRMKYYRSLSLKRLAAHREEDRRYNEAHKAQQRG